MKLRVLLAEDSASLRRCYTNGLEDDGHTVMAVGTAEQLIAGAEKPEGEKPQVLVIDARLPTNEMEGIVAVGELLRSTRVQPNVPVVFISLVDQDELLVQHKLDASGISADRYVWLLKPFEVELLAMTIEEEYRKRNP